jgi:uncharacterized protein YggT (Ycf19 family)
MRFLSKLTDGPLYFARRTFPLRLGGLDFSPLILIILLSLAGYLVSLTMLLKAQDIPLVHIFPIMAVKIIATLQSIIILIGILIVIRLILSLANPSYGNPLALFIYAATEPLLSPLRRWFPYGPGGLDVKALVFLAGLAVLYLLLGQLLPG